MKRETLVAAGGAIALVLVVALKWWWVDLIGVVIALCALWWLAERPKTAVDSECRDLLEARLKTVTTLHSSIAMPAGTIVAPFFSAMWKAHDLEDIGIQDIRNGRT